MSFYSYKNANGNCTCPGTVSSGNITNGLTEKICVQVKNIYDSGLTQEQLDDKVVTVSNIVPIVCGGCANGRPNNSTAPCRCTCSGNQCTCSCRTCGAPLTHEEAVENAESSPCPLPTPTGNWTFESCRSSTIKGTISDLSIERLCDRPQYGRVRGTIAIPIDVLFIDARCQEWMGQATLNVTKDVLLAIPDESIVPFTIESLVSAICVSGTYIGNCQFEITICVTIVLKVLAEVEVMIPSYGFCEIPAAEEFSESVCDEFFSLPLFPKRNSVSAGTTGNTGGCTGCSGGCSGCSGCSGCVSNTGTSCGCSSCSSCGTTCAGNCGSCPRCGCAMTASS